MLFKKANFLRLNLSKQGLQVSFLSNTKHLIMAPKSLNPSRKSCYKFWIAKESLLNPLKHTA